VTFLQRLLSNCKDLLDRQKGDVALLRQNVQALETELQQGRVANTNFLNTSGVFLV